MHPQLIHNLANARRDELLRVVERDRLARGVASSNDDRRIGLRLRLHLPKLAAMGRLALTGH